MNRWWQWLAVCLWRGHAWMPDAFPTDWRAEAGNMRGEAYTPSSTCTRCGARSF